MYIFPGYFKNIVKNFGIPTILKKKADTVESRKQVDLYYKSNLNITLENCKKHTMLLVESQI